MIRVTTNWSGLNTGYTLMHFDGTTADAQTAADAAATFWGAVDAGCIDAQLWAIDPEVLEVDVGTGQTTAVTSVTPGSGAGAQPGDPVPQAAHALIRWRTGIFLAGREIRGRSFVPGLSAASVTALGEVDAPTIAAFNTAADTLISSSDFGVWSPTKGSFATATSASTWPEFAVLRSRRD